MKIYVRIDHIDPIFRAYLGHVISFNVKGYDFLRLPLGFD